MANAHGTTHVILIYYYNTMVNISGFLKTHYWVNNIINLDKL